MNFNYYIPTKILFGAGSLNKLHGEKLPGKKALIVISAGKSTRKYGYLDRTIEQLKMAGVSSVVFDKILPNPLLEHANEGGELARKEGCDFVVGLGGGSSIDSAKIIAIMATNEGSYWDYLGAGSGEGKPIANDPLPIVAITTTAGTGTEADPWAVLTKTDTNEKIGSGYDKTFPVLSVVDPELMTTVPAHLTAYQGFDALFHSTEGYICNLAHPISDAYALKAIELIGDSLVTAVTDGENIEARSNVALANTISGMVESTSGCTGEHSIEHAMSAFHPALPHGAGLIMISKAYYAHYAKSGMMDKRMIDMAKALGKADASKAMDFVTALGDLQKACGVDNLKMSDYGISPSEFETLADNAFFAMGRLFQKESVPVEKADVIKILTESFA